MALREKLRHWFQDVMHESVSSHAIASGAALGTFVAILPTPGFNILLGVLVLFLYPKANKISLFAALALWNPITVTPLYFASYFIGDFLFTSLPVVQYELMVLDHLYNFSRRFLIGNVLIATGMALLTYVLVRFIVRLYRHGRTSSDA